MIGRALRRIGWRELCWLVAGIALIVLMRKNLLSYEDKLAPIKTPATFKQRVVAGNFAVTVDGFSLARRYKTVGEYPNKDQARVLKTTGVWVAVPVTIEALREPGNVGVRLRTRDGLEYRNNSEKRPIAEGVNLAVHRLVPGLPQSGTFFFELPPEQLPGAHLEVFAGSFTPMLSAMIDIDLGLGKANAKDLLARAVEEVDLRP